MKRYVIQYQAADGGSYERVGKTVYENLTTALERRDKLNDSIPTFLKYTQAGYRVVSLDGVVQNYSVAQVETFAYGLGY